MLVALITYFNSIDLVAKPLTILMLISVFIAAHFGLLKFLSESLRKTKSQWERQERIDSLEFATWVERFAFCVGIVSAFAVGLTLIRWIYPCHGSNHTNIICQATNTLIPLLTVSILSSLCFLTVVAGDGVFRRESKRLKSSLAGIDAVVCFKNGRRLTGGLYNLNVIKGYPYFRMRLSEGNNMWIDSTKIAAIFLLRSSHSEKALPEKEFTEGPRSLVLKLGAGETFEYSHYFEQSGFHVFRCYKKDTNTRCVIAPKAKVDFL